MDSRYSIFAPYSGTCASQYEEDVIRLFSLIQVLNPESKITINELDAALIRTGLSPHLLYEQASAGYYTKKIAQLDAELGLPVKEATSLGGYWQDRLVEVGKQHGKPLEETGNDLERAVEDGNAVGFHISKEELARAIVLLNGYEPAKAAFDFKSSMTEIQNMAASTTEDIKAISDAIFKMAEPVQLEKPTKKTSKIPYYHKKKANWWK